MSLTSLAVKDRRGRGAICRVTVAMRLLRSKSRSDCYPILLNMQSHILLNMHSHSREATSIVTPFDKYAKRLLRSHSGEATVTQFC